MKPILLLILVLEVFSQPGSNSNTYDYTNYDAISKNADLTGQTLSSTTADQSVVYITEDGKTIQNSNINKESGDSSDTEKSEFYGVNAAILVQGGGLTMTGGTITTKAKGANALCATNKGKVKISGTTITSTSSSSGRGLHATYGGEIIASNVIISSTGGSCANLATDRGEGTVTCTECTLSTSGSGSPLIYSTGNITVSKTTGTATGAQAVVIEGKNSATIKDSNLKCNAMPNRNDVDKCGVMLYQSQSGDAGEGTSIFNCEKSTVEIQSSSSKYSSAPMFFITNADAIINLEDCTFNYGSSIFLDASGTSEWGTTGSNGGVVNLNLKNQKVVGNFVVDNYSGLTINLVNSSIEGIINGDKTAAKLDIILDGDSTITLKGASYYTSLTNSKTDNSNIIKNTYNFEKYDEIDISRSSGSGGGGTGSNGSGRPSGSPPSGSGNPPSGSPPNGSGNSTSGSKASGSSSSSDTYIGTKSFNHLIAITLSLMLIFFL